MRALVLAVLLAMTCIAGCASPSQPPATPTPATPPPGGFSATAVFAGDYEKKDLSHVLVKGDLKVGKGEVTILKSTVGGVDIEVGVIRPTVPDGVKVPVIADASPYFSPLTPDNIGKQVLASYIVPDFVPLGYAYAGISVRGTAGSGGCMDLLGPLERADIDTAITWLGTQPWSNGNVGLFGISYDGSTPWQGAATGNPHLKTIVPIEGITDYFQLDYRNGTANSFGWGTELTGYYLLPFAEGPVQARSPAHVAEAANCPAMPEAAQAQAHAAIIGNHDALGFWDARNIRPLVLQKYNGSVFVSQGFKDDNVDPAQVTPLVNQLEAKGLPVKQLWGQWYHRVPGRTSDDASQRWDWHEMLLHWFDYWLKDDHTVDLGPHAEVMDSSGQWRQETDWPPADATARRLELSGDGTLLDGAGATTGTKPVPVSAPVDGRGSTTGDLWNDAAIDCPACPTFATGTLDHELRLAGMPTVRLTVTPAAPGGYIAAHLFAIKPGEGPQSVRPLGMGGGINLLYADGSLTAKPVVPGQKLVARLEMEPMDAVVPAGSRLVLVLHQGGFGSHLPPPDTTPVAVELGSGQSVLTIATFERSPAVFFAPPN